MTAPTAADDALVPSEAALRRVVARWAMEDRPQLRVLDLDGEESGEVECGDGRHRILFHGDRLSLVHHDEVAELTLAAFGASPPACLVYALAWREAFSRRSFFASWAAVERLAPAAAAHLRHDWNENYWESWPTEPAAASVLFAPPLQDRLALQVARRWALSPTRERARLLDIAVRVRARGRFVESIGPLDAHRKPDALVPLRVEVRRRGDGRMRGRLARSGSSVDLTLPVHWLWVIWGEGLALSEGRFVLGRSASGLRSVRWDPVDDHPDRLHLPSEELGAAPRVSS